MGKKATTIEQQIEILQSRNVIIEDMKKAKEILCDIGYYRLGYYFFPFEVSYPDLDNRTHVMRQGTKFSSAVALYYFDFDIRNTLMRYISRIEVAFRTCLTYTLSNKYENDPIWFVSPTVVSEKFINDFDKTCYYSILKYESIKHHHKKHQGDKYAPSWKTIEHMTFGNVIALYNNLKNINDKRDISKRFGVNQTSVFENYLEAVRCVRNICAHGSLLYDMKLYKQVRKGPAGKISAEEKYRLGGAIKVIVFLLGKISANRQRDLIIELNKAYADLINKDESVGQIVEETTSLMWDLPNLSSLTLLNVK